MESCAHCLINRQIICLSKRLSSSIAKKKKSFKKRQHEERFIQQTGVAQKAKTTTIINRPHIITSTNIISHSDMPCFVAITTQPRSSLKTTVESNYLNSDM